MRRMKLLAGIVTVICLGYLGVGSASGDGNLGNVNESRQLDADGTGRQAGDPFQGSRVTHRVLGVGSWREVGLNDADGVRIMQVVNPDAEGFGPPSRFLAQLGLTEGVVPPGAEVTQRDEEDGQTITIANSFASVSTWYGSQSFLENRPERRRLEAGGQASQEPVLIWRETTEVMGITMSVERFREQDGYVVEDDWGGWRFERYDDTGLTSLEDREGPVVWITRDLQGRLCEVVLGEATVLRYRYEGDGPVWSSKELMNLLDGRVLRRWRRGEIDRVARPRAEVKLPGHGPVAEWDAAVAPFGRAIAGLGGRPYGLLSFEGDNDPVRSITLADPSAELSWDRIDYTDTSITLHVLLDPAGLTNAAERTEVVVDLPRLPPTEHLEHIEGTPGTNCCTFCCGGGGGSGGGGSSGVPLPPSLVPKVNAAKDKATNTLNSKPECAALFNGLTRPNGASTIGDTSYRGATPGDTRCSGNDAFTTVGSLTVYVCPGFADLSSNGRAVRLIHEALHSAGMREKPQYPEAERTSAEINAWVKSTCGL